MPRIIIEEEVKRKREREREGWGRSNYKKSRPGISEGLALLRGVTQLCSEKAHALSRKFIVPCFLEKNRWMCVCLYICVLVCVCRAPLYFRVPSSLSPHPLPLSPARGPKPFPFYILYPVLSIVDPPTILTPSYTLPPPTGQKFPSFGNFYLPFWYQTWEREKEW